MITGFIEDEETIQSVSNACNNVIKIYRNTAWAAALQIDDNGDLYILGDTEKLIFTLKSNSTTIIRKVLTNDNYDEEENGYILLLNSAETDISAGTYYYNIKLQRSDGEYEPIILTNEFIIME